MMLNIAQSMFECHFWTYVVGLGCIFLQSVLREVGNQSPTDYEASLLFLLFHGTHLDDPPFDTLPELLFKRALASTDIDNLLQSRNRDRPET